jgi:signal transduction histidine kinase
MIVASRLWLLHLREVEQRADEAERTRDEAAQRRAMEERLRIARELHDSLTHSISVICVQAGVAVHLASLVARARAAGLPVTVTVTGTQRALPPEADRAAYRIVQEALTNVSRHAGRACARVHLHYSPDALSVQVDDDGADTGTGTGTGPRSAGPGLGLIGMRERVTALGGRLQAGPRDGGGFQVYAELPARTPS